MSDDKLRGAAERSLVLNKKYTLIGIADDRSFILGFRAGARWQQEQLRCETCKRKYELTSNEWYCEYDHDIRNKRNFGCILHEQKEEHEAKKES